MISSIFFDLKLLNAADTAIIAMAVIIFISKSAFFLLRLFWLI